MNLSNTCPDIPDNWRGGFCATAKVLGGDKPISRATLYKYVKLGRRNGGIDCKPSRNGTMLFTGREIKRFWNAYPL